MSTQSITQQPVEVRVQVHYEPEESRPSEGFFIFVYRIQIINHSSDTVQLLRRRWLIEDGLGRKQEVKGTGVVGLQPKISPGQSFEYESFCPLTTPYGSMKGEYEILTARGEKIIVPIPEFFLITPTALH